MSDGESVSRSCPLLASLELGSKLSETEGFYKSDTTRLSALGAMAQDKLILEGLFKTVGCEGPRYADGGYLVCPLTRILGDTKMRINGPPAALRMEYDYNQYLGVAEEGPTRNDKYL